MSRHVLLALALVLAVSACRQGGEPATGSSPDAHAYASGRNVASKATILSCAWFRIQAICSGCRRGLMVWITAPMPPTP